MNEKYQKINKNTFLFALGTFGSKAISFFLVPLYTNILSTAEYGIADLIIVFSGFLGPIFSLQISEAILYYGLKSNNKEREQIIKNALFVLMIGCISMLLCYPVMKLYKGLDGYHLYMLLYVVFFMLRNSMLTYTKACEKNHIYALDNIIYAVVVATLNIIFLLGFKIGIYGYLWAFILAEVLSFAWLFMYNKCYLIVLHESIDIKVIKKLLLYSSPLIINSISWTISSSTDRLMINSFLSAGDVGIYSAAQKLPTIIQTCMSFFLQAWTISAYLEYDEDDKMFYEKVFGFFSFVITMVVSLILVINKPFMSIYVGKEYRDAYLYVPFLLVSASFQMYAAYFGSIIQSGKKNYFMTASTLTAAIINVVLNWFMIQKFGIHGAVISTMFSYFIVFLMRLHFSRSIKSFYINYKKMFISNFMLIVQAICVINGTLPFIISVVIIFSLLVLNGKEIKMITNLIKKRHNNC